MNVLTFVRAACDYLDALPAWPLLVAVLLVLLAAFRLGRCSHRQLGWPYAREGRRFATCFACCREIEQPDLSHVVDRAGRRVAR